MSEDTRAAEQVKPRKKKKRRKKHYFLRFLILLALCAGLYYFANSEFFDVQKIQVEQNSYYTKQQIIKLSQASIGENLFKATVHDMKENLLADPYIKSVDIKKKLPHTIIITVEERQEAAAIPYGDTYVLIDKDGMVLRKVDTAPELTILEGLTIKTIEPGSPLEVEEAYVLTDTLELLQSMEENDMYFKKIDISRVMIKAYIYDYLVCQGKPENLLESMENGDLQAVLYDLYTKDTQRGVISIGNDNYISFSPAIE